MAVSTVQVIINGVTYDLLINPSTGDYEKTVTAPEITSYNNNGEHYFPITIKAVDSAGNATIVNDTDATFGAALKLRVKETTPPAIIITGPTDEEITSNPLPVINWTITDSGAGINPDTISIAIDDGEKLLSGITKTVITNGYQCSYQVPNTLKDGTHTVKIDGSDNDENKAVQRAVTFIVDTTPPELSVEGPINNLVTNNSEITVSGATNDITSGPCIVKIRINGGEEIPAEINSSGEFSVAINLTEGANTIVITSTDAGGISSSITRIVTLDTNAPIINDITITPNPVSTGELLNISVTVTD